MQIADEEIVLLAWFAVKDDRRARIEDFDSGRPHLLSDPDNATVLAVVWFEKPNLILSRKTLEIVKLFSKADLNSGRLVSFVPETSLLIDCCIPRAN